MDFDIKGARLSFHKLFKAEAFKPGDDEKFAGSFLIPKGSAQHKELEKACIAAMEEKFPGKGKTAWASIQGNRNKCTFQDGDTYEYDGYAGHIVIKAQSTTRPTVIDRKRNPVTEADGVIYNGCYVNAKISLFGYDNTGKGLSATLRGVQFLKDGDSFGGSAPAKAEDFEELDDEANEADDLS